MPPEKPLPKGSGGVTVERVLKLAPDDADVTARKLDFMRADIEEPGSAPAARLIAGHAARLLAAIDAILELHRRSDVPSRTHSICMEHVQQRNDFSSRSEWREAVGTCPRCTVTEKWVCAEPSCRHECPDDDGWPCPTVLAVTAELAGTGKAQLGAQSEASTEEEP